jgi:hypothetical protein
MHEGNRITSAVGAAILVLNVAIAQGQTTPAVAFVDITDAVAGRFFDATTTAADPADPNRLIIRFNTGRDPASWRANDFRASTAAFSHLSAMDTISFRVVPPDGYYVSKITYTQQGTGSAVRTGVARGGSNWVVGDYAADLGTYATNPSLSETIDLTGLHLAYVPVSITSGLHAFTPPLVGSASVAITGAEVTVEVEALPAPVVEESEVLPLEELAPSPGEEPAAPADLPAAADPAAPADSPAATDPPAPVVG